MRILLKLVLDCEPDAAWRAIRSPAVFRAVSAPFTTFTSLEPNGFPELWSPGEHPVAARAFGILPIGRQVIAIAEAEPQPGVRSVIDSGHGTSGVLASVTHWNHTMAVSATDDGGTLYRDRLEFAVGPFTILAWPLYWAFWQWRAARIRALAPTWS